jgi:hypothetical protein
MSNEIPENTRFEDGDFFEVAVDGNPVARYEEKGELSPEEDIAILLYMESIAETGREQFKENHGMEFSTAIEELGPDMDMMIGDEEGWLNVDLSDL